MTKKNIKQFKTNKLFRAFIIKCFVEEELDKKTKYKWSKGKIGYSSIAKRFKINRRTAITYIKISNAKPEPNKITHENIRFNNKQEYKDWYMANLENVFNGIRISDQPYSFFFTRSKFHGYCLIQTFPNRYKFTGVSLVNMRASRG